MRAATAILILLVGSVAFALPRETRPAELDDDLFGVGPLPVSVIVQTQGPVTPGLLARLGGLGHVLQVYSVIDGAHLRVPGGRLDELARLEGVARIDADDPIALHLDTSRAVVGSGPAVWDQGLAGEGVTVAVVDTGIDGLHPSLSDRVLAGVVFPGGGLAPIDTPVSVDTDGHGTHVAGIVGGSGAASIVTRPDDARFAGVAAGVQLVSLDISLSFTTSNAIAAFEWVHVNHERFGIGVVQNSWGRVDVGDPFDPGEPSVRASDALVLDDRLLVVFSAGNEGPTSSTISMEAQNPNVLTVAAVDDAGAITSFSSRGPVLLTDGSLASWTKPDVSAPGRFIMSAAATGAALVDGPGLYHELSGTSQAAPHIAGIGALVRGAAPDLGPLDVMELLRRTARDLGPSGPDADTGWGLVEAGGALDAALRSTGGSLVLPGEETFEAEGTLVLPGAQPGVALPPTFGAHVGEVSGTFPVKSNATQLDFVLTWRSSGPLSGAPRLSATLTTPDGTQLVVPATGTTAQRTVTLPSPGLWSWAAAGPTGGRDVAIDYTVDATVHIPMAVPFITGAGTSGYLDEGWDEQLESMANDLAERPLLVGAIVLGALLATMLLVLVVRGARR